MWVPAENDRVVGGVVVVARPGRHARANPGIVARGLGRARRGVHSLGARPVVAAWPPDERVLPPRRRRAGRRPPALRPRSARPEPAEGRNRPARSRLRHSALTPGGHPPRRHPLGSNQHPHSPEPGLTAGRRPPWSGIGRLATRTTGWRTPGGATRWRHRAACLGDPVPEHEPGMGVETRPVDPGAANVVRQPPAVEERGHRSRPRARSSVCWNARVTLAASRQAPRRTHVPVRPAPARPRTRGRHARHALRDVLRRRARTDGHHRQREVHQPRNLGGDEPSTAHHVQDGHERGEIGTREQRRSPGQRRGARDGHGHPGQPRHPVQRGVEVPRHRRQRQ